ncbi:biliverdin-producing heme oxygenase [Gynurincola endophyticus]|uniref:biliverdin-producing heme oxygenase n=1 Tax=Gynurincola endophyticus TaxID=2479004 RepID=UPI000F8CDC84|nr:biliverdin-producing heme oxygenase [Gynurincola endophyticus]
MLSNSIKEATKSAHQQLEVVVVKKLKAIRSHADYADLLKHFYSYFSTVEKTIAPYITTEVLPDYSQRRTSIYLKQDIEALGFSTQELPAAQAPEINSTIEALGALYVMEGSIMGGKIIVQMLEKGGITNGVSFFSGYGENTGRMWGAFTEVMNHHAPTEADEQKAIHAANETFSRFGDVFTSSLVANS